jgi:hypothetical protein
MSHDRRVAAVVDDHGEGALVGVVDPHDLHLAVGEAVPVPAGHDPAGRELEPPVDDDVGRAGARGHPDWLEAPLGVPGGARDPPGQARDVRTDQLLPLGHPARAQHRTRVRVRVRETDVCERNATEVGDGLTNGIGEVAPEDAEIDVHERGLDRPVGEHQHGGQEVHVDPLGPLVRLDAPAGVGDANGRGDDGAAHAGAERSRHFWTVISRRATKGRDWLLM